MIGLRRMLAITSALPLVVFLLPVSSASAATSLYYGSIRIIFPYGASSTYSIPFGANISYPHMNNLPAGNIATVSGSAPAAIGLGANQITLHTSLFTTSPPPSWYASEVLSTFSGGHAAGNFYENGGPGAASSAPLSSIPASQFGVTFKGTPGRFGGTLALLGNHRTRWGKVIAGESSRYCAGFQHRQRQHLQHLEPAALADRRSLRRLGVRPRLDYGLAPRPRTSSIKRYGASLGRRAPSRHGLPLVGRDHEPRLQGHRSTDAGRSGQHPARNAPRHPVNGGPPRFAPRELVWGGCRHRRFAIRSGAFGTLDAREWDARPRRPVQTFQAGRIDSRTRGSARRSNRRIR